MGTTVHANRTAVGWPGGNSRGRSCHCWRPTLTCEGVAPAAYQGACRDEGDGGVSLHAKPAPSGPTVLESHVLVTIGCAHIRRARRGVDRTQGNRHCRSGGRSSVAVLCRPACRSGGRRVPAPISPAYRGRHSLSERCAVSVRTARAPRRTAPVCVSRGRFAPMSLGVHTRSLSSGSSIAPRTSGPDYARIGVVASPSAALQRISERTYAFIAGSALSFSGPRTSPISNAFRCTAA